MLEIGISRLTHVWQEQLGQARVVLSRSPPRISSNQPDWAVVTFGMEEDPESAADLDPETFSEIVEEGATGLRSTPEAPRST